MLPLKIKQDLVEFCFYLKIKYRKRSLCLSDILYENSDRCTVQNFGEYPHEIYQLFHQSLLYGHCPLKYMIINMKLKKKKKLTQCTRKDIVSVYGKKIKSGFSTLFGTGVKSEFY